MIKCALFTDSQIIYFLFKTQCKEQAKSLNYKVGRVKEAVTELGNVFSAIYESKGAKKTVQEPVAGALKT